MKLKQFERLRIRFWVRISSSGGDFLIVFECLDSVGCILGAAQKFNVLTNYWAAMSAKASHSQACMITVTSDDTEPVWSPLNVFFGFGKSPESPEKVVSGQSDSSPTPTNSLERFWHTLRMMMMITLIITQMIKASICWALTVHLELF